VAHTGNRRHRVLPLLALITLLAPPAQVGAHPDIDEQLAGLERLDSPAACNTAAALKIGDLHRSRREWELAWVAYDRAARCDPTLDTVDFARGVLYLEAGAPEDAKRYLDRFLTMHPGAPHGLLARGRALMQLRRPAEAAADFDHAIAQLPAAQPDDFLARARAQVAAGQREAALRGLDAALQRHGPVPALLRLALDLEIEQQQYTAALARLDALTAQAADREVWLVRRGEILELAGRPRDARLAFEAAVAAIAARPAHRRGAPAVRDLETRARSAAERLAATLPAGTVDKCEARASRASARAEQELSQ
jgi:tetratricopeptide (TPR) repeat protein